MDIMSANMPFTDLLILVRGWMAAGKTREETCRHFTIQYLHDWTEADIRLAVDMVYDGIL
jgi:hypothetical protein